MPSTPGASSAGWPGASTRGSGVTLTVFPPRLRGVLRHFSLEEVWHVEVVVLLEDHGPAPSAGRVGYPPGAGAGRRQRRFDRVGAGPRRGLPPPRRRRVARGGAGPPPVPPPPAVVARRRRPPRLRSRAPCPPPRARPLRLARPRRARPAARRPPARCAPRPGAPPRG